MHLPAGSYILNAYLEVLMTDGGTPGVSHETADGLCQFSPNLVGGAHIQNPGAGGLAGAQFVQAIQHITLGELVQLSADGDVSVACSKFGGTFSVTHAQLDAGSGRKHHEPVEIADGLRPRGAGRLKAE